MELKGLTAAWPKISKTCSEGHNIDWVAVKEPKLHYDIPKAVVFSIYPNYGSLDLVGVYVYV